MKRFIGASFLVLLLAASSCKSSQSTVGYNPYRDQPSSVNPGSELPRGSSTRDAITRSEYMGLTEAEMMEEWEANRERVQKKYRRLARLRRRPQYSNPEYYGHRRKPKIRPVGKRKFCKECEIWH